jgi:hypothetical protein
LYHVAADTSYNPLSVISLCGVFGYVLTYYLNETFGKDLPSDIKERL